MTYNILTGGRDGLDCPRLQAILEVIDRESPDVLALQECNGFSADGHRLFHRFEVELGMRGLLAPAASGFDVALFVRGLPVLASDRVAGWCQHAMLGARLRWGDVELEAFSVHHNPFSGAARLQEAEFLAGRSRPERLQLLLGDFNANSPHDARHLNLGALPPRFRARHALCGTQPPSLDARSVETLLDARFVDMGARLAGGWFPTAPTHWVEATQRFPMRVDHVFASESLAAWATSYRVVQGDLTDRASDHYPVVVDFDAPRAR